MADESGAAGPRTVVVVICGVGDAPRGNGSAQLAHGLLRHDSGRFLYTTSVDEEYAATADWCGVKPDDGQTVTRHTLYNHQREPVADVYEAWWADLSRFPGATRSAFLAAIGMLQQATTIGVAALRGTGPYKVGPARKAPTTASPAQPLVVATSDRNPRGYAFGARLLSVIEWLVAVPIIVIVAIHLALLGAADVAMSRNGSFGILDRAGLAFVGALCLAGLVWAARWYSAKRPYVWQVGTPLLGLAGSVAIWRILADGGHADRGLADAILVMAVYPLRIAWMVVAALVLVASLTLLVSFANNRRRHRDKAAFVRHLGNRAATAGLSMFGPFGLAMVGFLAYAAFGVAVQGLAGQAKFGSPAPPRDFPWCVQQLNQWTPGPCSSDVKTAYDWGIAIFNQGIVPVLYVGGVVAIWLLITVLIEWIRSFRQRTILPRAVIHTAPHHVRWALPVAAALLLLAYIPGGDRVLIWQVAHATGIGAVAGVLTAATAWLTGIIFGWARLLKLNADTLRGQGTIGDQLRIPLDLVYDIATYLRDVGRGNKASDLPRNKILSRFAGLFKHLTDLHRYERCIIVAHSQGAVPATTLLAQPKGGMPIPGTGTALVTMGCPLRNLYQRRLPTQFGWVEELAKGDPYGYVSHLNGPWINFGADGDLVGRTVFHKDSDGPLEREPQPCPDAPDWEDRYAGAGGHGSYWTNQTVMTYIGDLILNGFEVRTP